MQQPLPIPLEIAADRLALARLYVDLTIAFHDTLYPVGEAPGHVDPALVLTAVAVMLGHAEGLPMDGGEIARRIHAVPSSTRERLKKLREEHGFAVRVDGRYYLEPVRAKDVPHRDTFELIVAQAFAALGFLAPKSGA